MEKVLVVTDMQNDFIDGALGTPEAVRIVPAVLNKIREFDGTVLFTRDTHFENYLETQEGRNLPVPHCIKGTPGWKIRKELDELRTTEPIDKITFGSSELIEVLEKINGKTPIESITFIGLCTDICVISNVFVTKAFFPDIPLIVDAQCCAGVSLQTHNNALEAMKVCQVKIENG